MAGAPVGNQNAAKSKRIAASIEAALAHKSRVDQVQALDEIAKAMVESALNPLEKLSDRLAVWKEIADRLDGKATQPIAGADGGSLIVQVIKGVALADDPPTE